MRQFQFHRPEAGFEAVNCARDLAWALGQMKGSNPLVLGISGGKGIVSVLELLAVAITKVDAGLFSRLHVFQTDEGVTAQVPPNWAMIMQYFGDGLVGSGRMDVSQFHPIPSSGDAHDNAVSYGDLLDSVGGKFHAALLSITGGTYRPLGDEEDPGCIAGIYPGNPDIWKSKAKFLVVDPVPRPPTRRLTVSPFCLGQADYLTALLIGEMRRNALDRLLSNGAKEECPARLLYTEGEGESVVYTDIAT